MPNIPTINFKTILLKPLLLAAFYKEGYRIISVLSECSFCIPSIISIMEESLVDSKENWKVLVSGLRVILQRNIKLAQGLELPVKYLRILNECLKHRTKTVRYEALKSILVTAGIIYRENVGDRQYLKKDVKNFSEKINQKLLKSVVNLKEFINSYGWQYICERWVGFKWEYPEVKPDFNNKLWLKVMRSFWPNFYF